jgi:hypothetical protein
MQSVLQLNPLFSILTHYIKIALSKDIIVSGLDCKLVLRDRSRGVLQLFMCMLVCIL